MSDRRSKQWFLPAVLLVSAAAIAYEILLMRLLSIVQWHHFAYMIISLALLGYGTSGTFIALFRRRLQPRFPTAFGLSALLFAVSMIVCFILGQRVPFNALAIVWDARQFLWLTALYLVFFVPFFFAAGCVGLVLTFAREDISRIYFVDLAGAGAGASGIIAALIFLTPPNGLRVLALAALLASVIAARAAPRRASRLVAPLGGLIVLAALPSSVLDFRVSPYKGLSQALQTVDARVIGSRSGPLGPGPQLRHVARAARATRPVHRRRVLLSDHEIRRRPEAARVHA
jgi:hypothetical protein